MDYTTTREIKASVEQLQHLIGTTEGQKQWQIWLADIQPLTGEPGATGATARFIYEVKGKRTKLLETIQLNDLPNEYKAAYFGAEGTLTTHRYRLEAVSPTVTLCHLDTNIVSKRFGIKTLLWMMPKLFERQSEILLDQLQEFAEKQPQSALVQ